MRHRQPPRGPRKCRACGTANRHEVAVSLNGPRRPDLRDAILDGSFQRFVCVGCGAPMRIEDPFVYLDFDARIWITCFPRNREGEWLRLEPEPLEDWKEAMVTHAAPIARELSAGFKVRAVFGVDALREKLLCFTHSIDDATLEALKLDLHRNLPDVPFRPEHRLRLFAVDGAELWLGVSGTDRTMPIPRAALDAIALDPVEWAAVTERLRRGAYVDLGRVMLASGMAGGG